MKPTVVRLRTPLGEEEVRRLRAGQRVSLSGRLYTARDQAHKLLAEEVAAGRRPPLDLAGQVIYYVGPTPAPPGRPVGSAGPTTAGRMDPYVEVMLRLGVRGFIGKGGRSAEVRRLLARYGAVYFGALGGIGALLARHVRRAEVVLFEELGTEAVHVFEVEDFPLFVVNDTLGGDLYEAGLAAYGEGGR